MEFEKLTAEIAALMASNKSLTEAEAREGVIAARLLAESDSEGGEDVINEDFSG